MPDTALKHLLIALVIAVAVTATARAGTTGVISGVVTDDKGAPVSDVHVTVIAPSDREETRTDASGHFAFLRLPPDTYTISLEKSGMDPATYAGVPLVADAELPVLQFRLHKHFWGCCRDFTRPSSPLVQSGQGLDLALLKPQPFIGIPNTYGMSIFVVPGIVIGSGGPIPH